MLSRAAKQLDELYREKNTCMEAGCKSSVYVGYSNCAGCNGRFCSKHLRYITFLRQIFLRRTVGRAHNAKNRDLTLRTP